ERGNYAMALYSDHTTSYQHGSDYPLALTLQYSGQGLWGRNYLIDRSTQVKYSLMPHTGTWQKAKVSEKSDCINEPLQAIIINDDKLLSKSYVKLPEGVMVSAANVVDNSVVIRLYNASGITGKKRVSLGVAAKSLTEIDLLGNEVSEIRAKAKQPDKTTFDVELPQYGIKTIKITI
ncbi:MAG: alpha-mannosidase, partial [bacterium]|nr:alpha-mannosidase [bacterium]